MKRRYIKPSTEAREIKAITMMLAGSQWNEDDQAGINPNPGSQEDYGAKENFIDYDW